MESRQLVDLLVEGRSRDFGGDHLATAIEYVKRLDIKMKVASYGY